MGGGDDDSSSALSAGTSESSSHIGAAKGTAPNDSTTTAMDAHNLLPAAKGPFSEVEAAIDMDAHNLLPAAKGPFSEVEAAMDANADNPPAKGSLSCVDAAKAPYHDVSTAFDMDTLADASLPAGKGSLSDVDAAKAANHDDPLATDVDADNPLATVKGKLPTAATAAPPEPILGVSVARPPPEFIEKAKLLIEQKDWQGLDKLLCQFVDDNTEKKPQDPGIFHPGLVIIAREQRVIQLLEGEEFEVATTYADEFLKPLKTCDSKFKPLNLELCIDDIIRMIINRSVSSKKSIGDVDVETAISDYVLLYFRAICQGEADPEVEGTWQFAKNLKSLDKETSPSAKGQRHRQAFSCLACGWTVRGTASISSLRYHISHSSKKVHPCPKVSQDMLDRLQMTMIDDQNPVPSLSDFVESMKKRKGSSSSSTAAQSLAVAPVKKLRLSSSHTVASSPPAACPVANPSSRGVDEKYLLQKVDILQKISTFMLANKDSVAPSARTEYIQKARELEKVAYDLKMKIAEDESAPPVQMPPQTQEETSG